MLAQTRFVVGMMNVEGEGNCELLVHQWRDNALPSLMRLPLFITTRTFLDFAIFSLPLYNGTWHIIYVGLLIFCLYINSGTVGSCSSL